MTSQQFATEWKPVPPSPSPKTETEPKQNASFGDRSRAELQEMTIQTAILRGSLNALSNAIVLVNQGRRVVFLNAAAERLFARCRELYVKAGKLCAANVVDAVGLEQLTQRAICGEGKETSDGAIMIRRGGRKPPLQMMAAPVPIDSQTMIMAGPEPVAMLVIHDPGCRTYVSQETIAAMFGLTPSEARLLLALSQGQTLKQYADESHVTQNTARTHLKSVFAKTKTSKQSDLVRLMGGLTHAVAWSDR